jgi:hypothetical protein
MSVEISVVTPISSAAGTAANAIHQSRRGGAGAGPASSTSDASVPPFRLTTIAAPTVASAKTAKPIDHQRAWSDRSRLGSTTVG